MPKNRKLIVAIDGPAGSGKSTVAKLLAKKLGYTYIDTGAMYRAVTLKAVRAGLDLADARAVEAAACAARLEFVPGEAGKIRLDGEDVSEAIRAPEISRLVSAHVASYPGVRQVLVACQRDMGANGGVVMEGRDITTVVFPRAEVKIFLSASQEERARRRFTELKAKGVDQPYEELLADLKRRDVEDANRPGGALVQAPDAQIVDSTKLNIDEVVETVIRFVRLKEGKSPMSFWYRLGYWMVWNYFHLFHRLRAVNAPVVPARGGVILAANHASYLDPPAVGAALPQRQLHFMARSSLFKIPLFGWMIHLTLAHPIKRGAGPDQDWGLFVDLLKRGEALLVFPEGTRTSDGRLQRGKSGFGRLAHMAKKPVYPVYIHGSYEAWPKTGKRSRAPITVYFGPEVPLEDLWAQSGEKRVLRQISDRVMEAIARLREQAQDHLPPAGDRSGGK